MCTAANPRISACLSAANPSSTTGLENTDAFPLYAVLPFQNGMPSSHTAHSLSKHASFRSAPCTEVLHVAPCVCSCSFQLLCGNAFRDWCLRLIIHSSLQAHLHIFQGFKIRFFVCEHSFHFSWVNIQEENDKDTGY